jgi:cell wall assembly regulator SMI1
VPKPPESLPVLRKGSSEPSIAGLEQQIERRLPAPLYAFFRSDLRGRADFHHDPKLEASIYEFLTAKHALKSWKTMMGIDDWNRDWVPIAWDGAGNTHFVVMAKGNVGFACQDPHGRRQSRLTLEQWLLQWHIELPELPRRVSPVVPRPPKKKAAPFTVRSGWAALEKWLDKNDTRLVLKPSLKPGATKAAVAAAEKRLGFPFPEQLRDFYLRHDGQDARKKGSLFGEGVKVFPLERLSKARPRGVAEGQIVLGEGLGIYDKRFFLLFDRASGALELYQPDWKRRTPVAPSFVAWFEIILTGLPKRKVTLQSNGLHRW